MVAALSRGQLRSLAITLKVLAHRYIKQVTKETPLFLLDDVLNELDASRRAALFANLPVAQTILTCTALPAALKKQDNVFLLDLRTIAGQSKTFNLSPIKDQPKENQPHFSVSSVPDQPSRITVFDRAQAR